MNRKLWISALAVTVGLAVSATALLATPSARAGGWFGHHRGAGHGGHGFGGDRHGPEHIRLALEWMLSRVDATDEQIEAIAAISESAMSDIHGLREQHHAQREALVAALGADEVDREGLEQLRAEGIGMAEEASTRLLTAVADAADVLTPEQRRALIEAHESFHRGGWFQ
jgi:protein CpxP